MSALGAIRKTTPPRLFGINGANIVCTTSALMEPTSEAETLALSALENDPDPYICIECGRPRRHNYCPAKGRGKVDHKVLLRSSVDIELQVYLYLLAAPKRNRT